MAFRETADPTRAAPDFPIQPLDQRLLASLADISVSPFQPQIPLLARHLFRFPPRRVPVFLRMDSLEHQAHFRDFASVVTC